MSCSPVKLIAAQSSTSPPSGYPMYIANLQVDPEKEDLWSQCHTPQNVWIRYPPRYKGINPTITADPLQEGSQIRFLDLEEDGGICGSDNKERVEALRVQTSENSEESSTLSCTSRLGADKTLSGNTQLLSVSSIRTMQPTTIPSPSDVLWAVSFTQGYR